MHFDKTIALVFVYTVFSISLLSAQQVKNISLEEAISLALTNSKQLRLSQAKIEQALAQYRQLQDKALPSGSISYTYNHAEIPANQFAFNDTSRPFQLPKRADVFLGTFALQEILFAGNKLRYAKQSTELLTQAARLDIDKNKNDIIYNTTSSYYTLYKLQQSSHVITQNIQAIDRQIHQAQRFFEQGLVTKNDVLRFQLQKSNLDLAALDLETNRKVVVYNMDVFLGLPETTDLLTDTLITDGAPEIPLASYLDTAYSNRSELKNLNIQTQVAALNIKSVRSDLSPTLVAGANLYYINPTTKFIPYTNTYLAPITVGGTLAWNFDRLWTTKNRLEEAKIQHDQVLINQTLLLDVIKTEVNQNYLNYTAAVKKIKILETSIEQAEENDKIVASKYERNVASVTDRIDANAQLFQSRINLELARADASIAYSTLLKSLGTIAKYNRQK